MKKLKSLTITLLIGLSIIIYTGIKTKQACGGVKENPKTAILSPQEFQALLNRLEPSNPIVEDGKIGKATISKWERVWMNQQAVKTFKELE